MNKNARLAQYEKAETETGDVMGTLGPKLQIHHREHRDWHGTRNNYRFKAKIRLGN